MYLEYWLNNISIVYVHTRDCKEVVDRDNIINSFRQHFHLFFPGFFEHVHVLTSYLTVGSGS